MEILACPSNSWTIRRSAPPSSRCVANEWRRVCGLTRSASPAVRAAALTAAHACCRASRPPAVAEEHRAAADRLDVAEGQQPRPRAVGPAREPVEGDVADRHEPLLVALADDPHEPAVDREVLGVEAQRLADPQPGRVEQLQQGPVAQVAVVAGFGRVVATGGLEQALGLLDRERLGQPAALARQVEVRRDVGPDQPLAVGEPVEALERRRATAEAGRGETRVARPAASRPRGQVADHRVRRAGPGRRRAAARREVRQVAAVGADRGRREAALDREVGEVVVDGGVEGRSGGHRFGLAVWAAAVSRPSPPRRATPRHGRGARGRRPGRRRRRGPSCHPDRSRHSPASGRARRSGPRGPAARPR